MSTTMKVEGFLIVWLLFHIFCKMINVLGLVSELNQFKEVKKFV